MAKDRIETSTTRSDLVDFSQQQQPRDLPRAAGIEMEAEMMDAVSDAVEASVETTMNRVLSSVFPDDEEGRQRRRKQREEAYKKRVKEEAGLWSAKGLALLPDGSVPQGAAAVRHALLELARGALRGAGIGLGIKGTLGLLFAVLSKKAPAAALKAALGRDTQKFTAFVAVLTGSFRMFNTLFTSADGEDAPRNAAKAGALAGLALLFDETKRRQMVALYLFSRSLDVVTKRLVRDGVLPYWKHFEAFMFGVSNMPIMYGFLFMPEILQPSYYKWILRMGVVTDKGLRETLRERRWAMARGETMPFRHCSHGYHQGPCTVHCTLDWFAGLVRASKIYLPVHVLPLLIFRHKALLRDPSGQLVRTARGFANSCAFLSTYVFFVKGSQCFLRNARGIDSGWHALVAGMLTGLSTYLEQPSRISELMLYCLPRGMEATWIYLVKVGLVRNIPRFEAVFMSLAMAGLISASKVDFKHTYYNSLCFLLGSESTPLAQKERQQPTDKKVM